MAVFRLGAGGGGGGDDGAGGRICGSESRRAAVYAIFGDAGISELSPPFYRRYIEKTCSILPLLSVYYPAEHSSSGNSSGNSSSFCLIVVVVFLIVVIVVVIVVVVVVVVLVLPVWAQRAGTRWR